MPRRASIVSRRAPETLDHAFAGWIHLFGLVSFEVFGRLDDLIGARAEYFEHQLGLLADLAGLPASVKS